MTSGGVAPLAAPLNAPPRRNDGSANDAPPSGWRARLAERVDLTKVATPLLYSLYTVLAFVLFLLVTFPHELVLQRILSRAATGPVEVEVRGLHLGWTLAYTMDELRLLRRGGDPAIPLLTAQKVRVAPSWLSLLRGHPYPVGVRGDLYGGTADATVDLRPDAYAIDARFANLDVGRYAGLRLFMEGTLRGRVEGEVTVQGNAAKPATTNGRIGLRAARLALEGGKLRGITVPDLHFPEVRIAGEVKKGRLELGDVNATGDEISARGEGNVVLQHPLAGSLMNLTLVVQPAAQAPENLRLALNLLPGTPGEGGERTVRLYGSFEQPRVQ